MRDPTKPTIPLWKRPVFIPLCVAALYVISTWGLYLEWMSDLESFMEGVKSQLPDDQTPAQGGAAIAESFGDAPQMSSLLRILLFPVPAWVSAENGGAIKFWAVLLLGLIIASLLFWWTRRTRPSSQ
jgi:hypothetical protein